MKSLKPILLMISVLMLSSCASKMYTTEEVLSRDNAISQLQEALEKAESEELQLFTPIAFQEAKAKYELALKKARSSESPDAGNITAKEGLNLINQGERTKRDSQKVLRRAYTMRERALDADAAGLFPKRTRDAEVKLINAARLVEQGADQQARIRRDEVVQIYSRLELDSLKKGITAEAYQAFDDAKKYGADEFAPKSFQLAQKEIDMTKEVLNTARNVELARTHAQKAKYLSERAKQIAILAKSFGRRDFTKEDIALWYHDQLNRIAKPLNTQLRYNRTNKEVVDSVIAQIMALKDSIKDGIVSVNEREQKITQLKARISSLLSQQEKEDFLEAQRKARYDSVRKLFKDNEARVYRAKDGVLIKAHGFNFPVGKPNIEVQNYPLIKKIIDSIHQFPKAKKIVISGHTDATGSDSLNLELSKERALNVKKLLASLGQISTAKMDALGFGETKPVETNNTAKGRAFNRRIEVKIKE